MFSPFLVLAILSLLKVHRFEMMKQQLLTFNFPSFCSINFNIVSKGLGSQKMSFYLNEAAGDMRDLLVPTIETPKAKL